MSVMSKQKQEILIGLLVCVVLLTLYPNIHTSLLLSFVLMMYFIYRYCRNIVSNYLDTGIAEIKNSIDILEFEKDKLQKKVEELRHETSISEESYKIAIENAKIEAQDFYNKKMLEVDNTIKEIEVKNKMILKSIEDDYLEVIKNKITDLIIDGVIAKMNDPKNVKNVTLTGISRAVDKLQDLKIGR